MLRSMTGFGTGRAQADGEELSVELRSVNHKFCEVKVRLPREWAVLEPVVVREVKDRLARGAVEVTVKRGSAAGPGNAPGVDVVLAREYRDALGRLAQELGLDPPTLGLIVSQPGVLRLEERSANLEAAGKAISAALGQALAALTQMREKEGAALVADLEARLSLLAEHSRRIAGLGPAAVETYRQRLADRVAELARGVAVDPARLAQEVALFAERTDIAEELTRLSSHLEQFRALLRAPEPVGRKMDFLVQEMHREVNTTGSKSQHPEISTHVVALKAELERIREQVQNVE